MTEENRASIAIATAILDETRRRFEASERRFDDLRNRARTLAAAIAALVTLDIGLIMAFMDPAKQAPIASVWIAVGAAAFHLFYLRWVLLLGYVFEEGKGLIKPREIVLLPEEMGHIDTLIELSRHYANAAADMEGRYAIRSATLTGVVEGLVTSLLIPILAVCFYVSRAREAGPEGKRAAQFSTGVNPVNGSFHTPILIGGSSMSDDDKDLETKKQSDTLNKITEERHAPRSDYETTRKAPSRPEPKDTGTKKKEP